MVCAQLWGPSGSVTKKASGKRARRWDGQHSLWRYLESSPAGRTGAHVNSAPRTLCIYLAVPPLSHPIGLPLALSSRHPPCVCLILENLTEFSG